MKYLLALLFCYNCYWWTVKTKTNSRADHHLLCRFIWGEGEGGECDGNQDAPTPPHSVMERQCPYESYRLGNWTIPFVPHFRMPWIPHPLLALSLQVARRKILPPRLCCTHEPPIPRRHRLRHQWGSPSSFPFIPFSSSCPMCAPAPPFCPSPVAFTVRSTRHLPPHQPDFTRMSPWCPWPRCCPPRVSPPLDLGGVLTVRVDPSCLHSCLADVYNTGSPNSQTLTVSKSRSLVKIGVGYQCYFMSCAWLPLSCSVTSFVALLFFVYSFFFK